MAIDERLLNYLKKQPELVPDEHDGSYELVRETIKSYAELDNLDEMDYSDLNLIYFMSTIWNNINKVKEKINNNHLHQDQKERLLKLSERIFNDTRKGKYTNNCFDKKNDVQVGMFSMKIFGKIRVGNDLHVEKNVRQFIQMCINISVLDDEILILENINDYLLDYSNCTLNDVGKNTVTTLLHCIKPTVFPIINGNTDKNRIYDRLDIKLENKDNLVSYVSNCRKIKAFRDNPEYNFKFKNYRVIDLAGMIDFNSDKAKEEITMNATEHKSVPLNRIFYGPPGTGKTYNTVNCAVEICEPEFYKDNKSDYSIILKKYNELKETGRTEFITFHQSYGYEEFIEGIRPVLKESGGNIGYELHSGCFKNFCDKAKYENVPYVFIIDEINRGNISKIFGELITLIEDSKRIGNDEEMTVKLPYSGEKFGVPNNVYIIGTMNTADRSIALMDTALRRRFVFAEMMPDAEFLNGLMITADGKTLDVKKMFEDMNERIECLFDREHTIGHAYFANLKKAPLIGVLADIFRNRIIPLLQEYFFEDYEKLAIVLSRDENSCSFIEKKEFMNTETYKFNDDALNNIESYLKIYEESSNEQSV